MLTSFDLSFGLIEPLASAPGTPSVDWSGDYQAIAGTCKRLATVSHDEMSSSRG